MKRLIISILLFSNFAMACPGGQHDECALWNPFANSCAQWICVPDVKINPPHIEIPKINFSQRLQAKADETAQQGQAQRAFSDKEGCIMLVTSALAAWGATQGGAIGMAICAGAGLGAATLACNKLYGSN